MKATLLFLFLFPAYAITVGAQSAAPTPLPRQISYEAMVLWGIAASGQLTDGDVESYARSFDAINYQRSMADEFERNAYRVRIRTELAEKVRKVDLNEKFVFVQTITLGEYSFQTHSFPIVSFPRHSVSSFQFSQTGNWSVPMTENDASTFVKSRLNSNGYVNRNVVIRVTFSFAKASDGGDRRAVVHYFEIFSDNALTQGLAFVSSSNSFGSIAVNGPRLPTASSAAKYPNDPKALAARADADFRRNDFAAFDRSAKLALDAGSSLAFRLYHHHSFLQPGFHSIRLMISGSTISFDPQVPNAIQCNFLKFELPVDTIGAAYVAHPKGGFFERPAGTYLTLELKDPKDPKKKHTLNFADLSSSFVRDSKGKMVFRSRPEAEKALSSVSEVIRYASNKGH